MGSLHENDSLHESMNSKKMGLKYLGHIFEKTASLVDRVSDDVAEDLDHLNHISGE